MRWHAAALVVIHVIIDGNMLTKKNKQTNNNHPTKKNTNTLSSQQSLHYLEKLVDSERIGSTRLRITFAKLYTTCQVGGDGFVNNRWLPSNIAKIENKN